MEKSKINDSYYDIENLLQYPFNPYLILKKRKSIRKSLLDNNNLLPVRIAILGGSTTYDIVQILELFLLNYGIRPYFHESEYGQYFEEIMYKNEKLLEFKPDIIYIHTNNRNISKFPNIKNSPKFILDMINEEFDKFKAVWDKISQDYNCTIIQNNFELPFYRLLGNKDSYDIHGRTNYILKLNSYMCDYAEKNQKFYINDINYLSSCWGLDKWSDPSTWYLYKYFCCIEAIPTLAFNLANIVKSIYGKNKKVIALDLDNTIWGGIVGDDGVEGLEIGQDTAIGQAYFEFQEYIKAHKDLGVLLSINSKNDYQNAIAGLNHPDGILNPDDFISIKANWQNKDFNIHEIASEINILEDSFVFIDDNPVEREFVKAQIEEIAVPPLDKIENYIKTIDKSGFFESTDFSEEDLVRNEMYKVESLRGKELQNIENYNEYLKSLKMKGIIEGFKKIYLQRIIQLINKSNQFNLTTKRYSQSEIDVILNSEKFIHLYGKLEDKYGDYGVVSVLIAQIINNIVHIDLWLMSCRVLNRGMEYAMLDKLVEQAQLLNISKLIGYYFKTDKNKLVRDLYSNFGFIKINEDQNGNSVWELSINEYQNKNSVIEVIK